MKLRYCISFMYVLASIYQLQAQPQVDSLKQQLAKASNDSSRIALTFSIAEYFWFSRNIEQALPWLHSTIRLSDEHDIYTYKVNALNILANTHLKHTEYDSAFYYLKAGLDAASKHNETKFVPLIYETYHHIYYELGDYNIALRYAFLAAGAYENSAYPEISAQALYAYISIGQIFRELNQTDKALMYFEKAMAIGRKSGKAHMTDAMLNIANVYKRTGNTILAKQLLDSVIILDASYLNHESSMFAYEVLAQIAMDEKKYDDAVAYLQKALKYAKEGTEKFYIDDLLAQLGKASSLQRKFDTADSYFREALHLAKSANDTRSEYNTYSFMADNEKERGNYRLAIDYQQASQKLKDSLLTSEKIRFTNNLEILHRTEENQNKLISLQAQNENAKLDLLRRNKLLLFSIVLLLAMIIAFFLYHRNSKYKNLVARQQEELHKERIDALENEKKVLSLQSVVKGQELERSRLARDLHDSLGGILAIIKSGLLDHQSVAKVKQGDRLDQTIQLTDGAIKELRRISHNLAPEVLLKLGLSDAVLQLCNQVRSETNLVISPQIYGLDERLPFTVEINLFRIIQELLHNTVKHAAASEVIIQLNRIEQQVILTVEDNGRGFTPTESNEETHLGLISIKGRVESLNGKFSLESNIGVGTTAIVQVPLENHNFVDT